MKVGLQVILCWNWFTLTLLTICIFNDILVIQMLKMSCILNIFKLRFDTGTVTYLILFYNLPGVLFE